MRKNTMRRLIWYDLRYLHRIARMACLCGGLPAALFVVVSLLYNRPHPWAWLLLLPAVMAATFGWWLLQHGLRERTILRAEAAAGLSLPNAPLPEIVHQTLYGNEEWLVLAGKLAVHRSFVERVTTLSTGKDRSRTYYIRVCLKNGRRYTIRLDSPSTGRKIRNWSVH